MGIHSFGEELRALVNQYATLRPFVCNGDPLNCKAFVVGTNPASEVPFFPFWDDQTGFDRDRWLECYSSKRAASGREPLSATRQRIERIVRAAAPVQILETNLFSAPTRREADLTDEHKRQSALDFLLSSISPSVIVVHGAEARKHFEKRFGQTLAPNGAFSEIELGEIRMKLCTINHLSRVSYDDASRLGEAIRAAVTG